MLSELFWVKSCGCDFNNKLILHL